MVKLTVFACCMALTVCQPSDCLLLSSFKGCATLGCRVQALEQDVALLKSQVARMSDPNMNTNNNYRPNQFNQQPNNQGNFGNQGGMNQQVNPSGNMQQNGQQQGGNRVNYALDFPNQLQRVPGYPTALTDQRFRS